MNRRCLTSTLPTTWKRDTSWHLLRVMVLPRLRSRKRMACSESYTTTANSTNTPSSTLPRSRKYPRSSKNSEESHFLANLTFEQGIITSAYCRRTRTKLGLRQTRDYSNGLSCHSDYATRRPPSLGCSTKSSAQYTPSTQAYSGITWTTLSS